MAKNTSIVTRKGQITIPIEMRRDLGIHEGDKVEFIKSTNGMQVLPVPASSEKDPIPATLQAGSLSKYAKSYFTNDQERIRAEKDAAALGWTERERRYISESKDERRKDHE